MQVATQTILKTEGRRLPVLQTSGPLSTAAGAAGDECDISGLLEMLDTVTDPRSPRGRIYNLSFLLAAAFVAVLAGAKKFLCDWTSDQGPVAVAVGEVGWYVVLLPVRIQVSR